MFYSLSTLSINELIPLTWAIASAVRMLFVDIRCGCKCFCEKNVRFKKGVMFLCQGSDHARTTQIPASSK